MRHLLITGASGNLGRELIKYFDFQNYDYIYLAGKDDVLKKFNLNSEKFKIIPELDLTTKSNIKKIFDLINEKNEDELFIIHLVGKYKGGKKLWEYDEADLLEMFNINFLSSFLIANFSIQKVARIKGGSIIFISSRLTFEYEPGRAVYTISKQSLNFLVKIIEKEANHLNFSANVIAPSVILTEENKKWINKENYQRFVS
ncbi:MAG: SDR family oxidoreductase, partial [Ignavibacteria bacterium]